MELRHDDHEPAPSDVRLPIADTSDMVKLRAVAAGLALGVGASGCLGSGASADLPKRFPAEAAPEHGRLIGCVAPPYVECFFLVSGDSHQTSSRLANQARAAGWGRARHSRGLGVDVLDAWRAGYEMKIIVSPAGARVSRNDDVPRLPRHVPAGQGLVDISWGPAEDGR
jgi:hypothetical protein